MNPMDQPRIAEKVPAVLTQPAGDYYWCKCGLSARQPFCDGSHKDTGFSPLKVTLPRERRVAWCQCKQTKNPPYCDGAHVSL